MRFCKSTGWLVICARVHFPNRCTVLFFLAHEDAQRGVQRTVDAAEV